MPVTDIELVNRFKKGEDEIFAELVKRYQKKVYNTTYRMLGNKEDASDLAQESFLKVYKNLHRFQGRSSFSTWLFKITANLCRDELRKRQRDLDTSSLSKTLELNEGEVEPQIADDTFNPEKISLNQEMRFKIQEVINRLPLKQKEVIVLREIQGFTYEKIAEILDIALGTVKSRISRARRKMKDSLHQIVKGELK